MVHITKRYTVLVLMMLLGMHALAQKKGQKTKPEPDSIAVKNLHAGIKVFAKAYGDSIVVRWAPDDKWAWTSLNYTGYFVERIDVTDSIFTKQLLTQQPLKPMTLEEMKAAFAGTTNKFAAIAAQCLYGKNFALNTRQAGAGGIKDKSDVWNSRYAFALEAADFDAATATATGLRLVDKNVLKKHVYIYAVYPAVPTNQGMIDTGGVAVTNVVQRAVKPTLNQTIAGDKMAELHWARKQKEQYSAYNIERSSDGKLFTQVNKVPFISSPPDTALYAKADSMHRQVLNMMRTQQAFVDSLPDDNHKYYYRIKGVNAFGEWSDYSDTLSVTGIDLTAPIPPDLAKPKYIGGRTISLHWTKKVKEPDFKGFIVVRSHLKPSAEFKALNTKLLDTTATSFTDTAAFVHGSSFYRIGVVDTAGNINYSNVALGVVPDTTPPLPPTGLQGRIDKKGYVYLHWDKNTEEDMKGYKVYFANSSEHVYSQITITPDSATTFTDTITLKTLTKNIWYKVVAVDENNNHSGYSAPVELKKPDVVPPVPPLASLVAVDTSGVKIDWVKSASNDAAFYIIYRKQQEDSIWMPMAQIKHDSTKPYFYYIDKTIKPFVTYNYSAETVDEDSLHSVKSVQVTAAVKTVAALPPLQTLKAVYNDKAKAINLQWDYKNNGDYYFVLFRGVGNDALLKFHTASQEDNAYSDTELPTGGGSLKYAIQVVFKDSRGKTRVSAPVAVTVQGGGTK